MTLFRTDCLGRVGSSDSPPASRSRSSLRPSPGSVRIAGIERMSKALERLAAKADRDLLTQTQARLRGIARQRLMEAELVRIDRTLSRRNQNRIRWMLDRIVVREARSFGSDEESAPDRPGKGLSSDFAALDGAEGEE